MGEQLHPSWLQCYSRKRKIVMRLCLRKSYYMVGLAETMNLVDCVRKECRYVRLLSKEKGI